MSKHTPGPWPVDLGPRGKDGSFLYFPSVLVGYRPGLLYSDGSGDDESVRRHTKIIINSGIDPKGLERGELSNTMETCHANAHLIAAAPEMLEAAIQGAELIELWMNGICKNNGITWESEEDHPYALQALRAAISKAKGGQE